MKKAPVNDWVHVHLNWRAFFYMVNRVYWIEMDLDLGPYLFLGTNPKQACSEVSPILFNGTFTLESVLEL